VRTAVAAAWNYPLQRDYVYASPNATKEAATVGS